MREWTPVNSVGNETCETSPTGFVGVTVLCVSQPGKLPAFWLQSDGGAETYFHNAMPTDAEIKRFAESVRR